MNERIQKLAEQANITIRGHYDETGSTPLELEKFAALVAAAEREACAGIAELVAVEIDDTNGTATYIAKAIRAWGDT
jgi:hypothetical protein